MAYIVTLIGVPDSSSAVTFTHKMYLDRWMGGWMDGWVDGSKSRVKDCLQQSKIYTIIDEKKIKKLMFCRKKFQD